VTMGEEAEVIVVSTNCPLCHQILCDYWEIIKRDNPFIIDVRFLKMLKDKDFETIKDFLMEALNRWEKAQAEYKKEFPEAVEKDIVPLLVTDKADYIGPEVYTVLFGIGKKDNKKEEHSQ